MENLKNIKLSPEALRRTVVPMVVGVVLAVLLVPQGVADRLAAVIREILPFLSIDNANLSSAAIISIGIGALYYIIISALAARWPDLNLLLGGRLVPVYVEPEMKAVVVEAVATETAAIEVPPHEVTPGMTRRQYRGE